MTQSLNIPRLIPLTKWNDYFPHPPIGGLRSLVFNAKTTGFDRCVKRIGKRVLIDSVEFFEWVDSQNPKSK